MQPRSNLHQDFTGRLGVSAHYGLISLIRIGFRGLTQMLSNDKHLPGLRRLASSAISRSFSLHLASLLKIPFKTARSVYLVARVFFSVPDNKGYHKLRTFVSSER
jgi:hypothetical protein